MADGHPELIRLPQAEPFFAKDIWVLTPPDLLNSLRIKAVMNYFVDAVEGQKAQIQGFPAESEL